MHIHFVDIEKQLYDMLSMEHDGVRYITYSSFKSIIDIKHIFNLYEYCCFIYFP